MYYYFVMYRADRLYSIDDEYNSNVYFGCNSVKQYLEDFCIVNFKSVCIPNCFQIAGKVTPRPFYFEVSWTKHE